MVMMPRGLDEWPGLRSDEAKERQHRDGPNEIPTMLPPPIWRQLGAQLFHFFALLLWAAGALAIIAGMLELGVAIFFVIVVNGLFAYTQEYRAERAAQRLHDLLPRRALVRRDGAWVSVEARELVHDDVIALAAGDRVSADIRVLHGIGLLVDTSTLTGESVPVPIATGEHAFAGTFVVEGEAVALVCATASHTKLSRIAELTRTRRRPPTPLARELHRLVRIVATLACSIGALFFAVGSILGLPLRDGFLFAIGVAVALVPEGLLPTVTLSLAMGAWRMAGKGALVRRLEAVETLGSTTFICTDKTGTLTMNQMNVVEAWTPSGVAFVRGEGYEPRAEVDTSSEARARAARAALAAARCSNGRAVLRDGKWVARGDPMEAAIFALARRLDIDVEAEEKKAALSAKFPFDARRRRMSVLVGDAAYVKGAPDAVLPQCLENAAGKDAAADMIDRGLRVIAVAARSIDPSHPPPNAIEAESGLELIGLLGLLDPPRPGAKHALAACRSAGMRVAMVTGDHPGTAVAVAREVGLPAEVVLTGADLPDDDAALGELIDRDGVIVSRVSPEQKLRIARVLQGRGHVVAMTGDGVNDGPALHQADIGIAMGQSGTDVARDAADVVLLADEFSTIVLAIEQGRTTFENIRRFLTYHLTDNVAELAPFVVWALSLGRFPLAIGVLQILCLDLLTDQLPALALGAEPPSPSALQVPPHGRHLVDRALLLRAFGVLGPTEALVELLTFTSVLAASGYTWGMPSPPKGALAIASGAAFLSIVAGQTATALACRSAARFAWRVPPRGNPLVFGALAATWAMALVLVYVPPLAHLLGQAPPSPAGIAMAAFAVPVVLLVDAVHKILRRRGQSGRSWVAAPVAARE